MSEQNTLGTAAKSDPVENTQSAKRKRSSIGFPYMDLDEAVTLAAAIHKNVGTGSCSVEQLAPWMKQSPTSSAFRTRLGTSRLFGLVDTERSDALRLTELGRLIVDAKRAREGRAKAFLAVPLFRALHDKFKGGVVPPVAALEKEMIALGVASTLKETARRVFERSAEQSGFFAHGRDRLVMPGFVPAENGHEEPEGQDKPDLGGGGSGHGSGGNGGAADPLIAALIQKLPKPQNGRLLTEWCG